MIQHSMPPITAQVVHLEAPVGVLTKQCCSAKYIQQPHRATGMALLHAAQLRELDPDAHLIKQAIKLQAAPRGAPTSSCATMQVLL